jgi:para-nitrobenzyl esterase
VIVSTEHGALEGVRTGTVTAFTGIPFAASPAGGRRFRPPEPPEPWTGVGAASQYGPAAPQPYDPILDTLFGQAPFATDEGSCLTLNIWAPAPSSGAMPLPVMVWLHGGAFITGSGQDRMFDGSRLAARHEVLVVTVNYRLGALGFLHLGDLLGGGYEASGNVGLLDQIAALKWVAGNIAAFGGDPDRITVFGQSAGAMSVATLMTMPAARGLFHRAIIQSGSAEYVHTPDQALAVTRRLLGLLEIADTDAVQVLDVPAAELIAAQSKLSLAMRSEGPDMGLPFAPVLDGVAVPELPLAAFQRGAAARIPVVLGTNADEGRLFVAAADEGNGGTPAAALDAVAARIGDELFQAPADRLADAIAAAGTPVWRYLFAWKSRALGGRLGACHSLELPFVFDTLDLRGVERFTGTDPPQSLAERIGAQWTAFARHGEPEPDWPRYDEAARRRLVLGVSAARRSAQLMEVHND